MSEHGKIKWYDAVKKYGFIKREGAKDAFLHASEVSEDEHDLLQPDVKVEFTLADGKKGPQAKGVKVIS